MSGSSASRCSAVPYAATGKQDSVCTDTPRPTASQPAGELLDTCR